MTWVERVVYLTVIAGGAARIILRRQWRNDQ